MENKTYQKIGIDCSFIKLPFYIPTIQEVSSSGMKQLIPPAR